LDYDATLYENATNIPASLFSGLGVVFFALPAVFGIMAVVTMYFYPMLRKSQRDPGVRRERKGKQQGNSRRAKRNGCPHGVNHDPSDQHGLGRVEVSTIPLPLTATELTATYTFSGSVLVSFKTLDDPQEKDFWNIAVVNDDAVNSDGGGFRVIFAGPIPQHPKANGIRFMVFADNRRVLLGDYVLECDPDIDRCERATLVPVHYPWHYEHDPRTFKHWSEIIIAPDNEHICWTILRTDIGAAVGLGALKREADAYIIEKPQIISTVVHLEANRDNPGYLLQHPMCGGEVKQFVWGGRAISVVGAKDGAITDSVVQDLASGEITQITRTPGYDETTIFSPDERLGIVMSTRAFEEHRPRSPWLAAATHAVGWSPRGIIQHLYMYAVAGVRSFRKGNIGPVLIDIERSMCEPGYLGLAAERPRGGMGSNTRPCRGTRAARKLFGWKDCATALPLGNVEALETQAESRCASAK
jgi:hypothetical protein